MITYKCGHCNKENVTLERKISDTSIDEVDYPDMTLFKFQCPDCGFRLQIPVPNHAVNTPGFDPELLLLDIWESQSKKAVKHGEGVGK